MWRNVRHMLRHLALVSVLACLVAGCQQATDPPATPASTSSAAWSPAPSVARPAGPIPIVIDADFDQSDIAAILALLRDPRVDVRAIAIDGTGLVHCGGGRLLARYILEEMGTAEIPFGCGRQRAGDDGTPFPDDWRAVADTGYGLDLQPRVETEFPPDAVTVIRDAIDSSPTPVTIVALGPWTNLEDAFATDPTLATHVTRIHAMLGTMDAPGNVFVNGHDGNDPLEWNAFADPSAVQAVFATGVPIDLVSLDATDDVPVPADLTERLAGDHAAGGADLLYELLLRNPSRMDISQGQQLWDELAALALSEPGLVTWDDATVAVGDDGRLTRDATGRTIRFANAADATAVESALLTALGRGGPRRTPFELAGTIAITWDGQTCAITGGGSGPGLYTLTYDGPAGKPAGAYIAGVRSPHVWSDLTALVAGFDVTKGVPLPDWVLQGGQAVDEAGTGDPVRATAELELAPYGPVCVTGDWPDLSFTPGQPIGSGG